jgi:hypothetical protein
VSLLVVMTLLPSGLKVALSIPPGDRPDRVRSLPELASQIRPGSVLARGQNKLTVGAERRGVDTSNVSPEFSGAGGSRHIPKPTQLWLGPLVRIRRPSGLKPLRRRRCVFHCAMIAPVSTSHNLILSETVSSDLPLWGYTLLFQLRRYGPLRSGRIDGFLRPRFEPFRPGLM